MTKAEIDDIFGEFEIDEDYMIKTKDVIGLFVAVKEEPKVEEPAPVEEAPEADPDKPANFEDSTFQTRNGQYGGGNHPNNIVAWYLTSTNISFIMNSQFTNKYILLWGTIWGRKSSKQYCRLVFDFNEYQFHYEFA